MEMNELIEGTLEDYWTRLETALEELTTEELTHRPTTECNSISFILWHMIRVEDRWIQYFTRGDDDLWVKNNWYKKLGLPESDHGVGFTLDQVANFPTMPLDDLLGYFHEVRGATQGFIRELQPGDLDVVPGRIPFPPNAPAGSEEWSLGRMFRQLFGELNQHLGQIRYLRGMIKGFNS